MGLVNCRVVLWVMIFTSTFVTYLNRVNLSILILAMTDHKTTKTDWGKGEVVSSNNAKGGPGLGFYKEPLELKFYWTPTQQAHILGSYFYGYTITSLIGGTVAEYFGPRYTLFCFSVISGVLTLICPLVSQFHYTVLMAVRVILGLAGGFTYPGLHCLIAHWIPQIEKGKFGSALMGGTFGTVVTWSVLGVIVEPVGWEACFYIAGIFTIVWAFFWFYLVYDTPHKHPRIDEKEKKYISDLLADKVQDVTGLPPFKHIFTSFPFLAMVILHYGNLWGLYFIMTTGPMFLKQALKFNLQIGGFTGSLPYLSRVVFSVLFGALGDWLLEHNKITVDKMRKTFCIFSHIIPGCFLILNGTVSRTAFVSMAFLVLSMGCNGAATLTNLQNHQDLSPNYAGTLYGIANGIGSSAGVFTPMVAAALKGDGETIQQWSSTFCLGGAVYILAALIFICFGRTEIQSWNYANVNGAGGSPSVDRTDSTPKTASKPKTGLTPKTASTPMTVSTPNTA